MWDSGGTRPSKLRLDPEWDQRSQRLWASLVAQLVKNLPAMQETPGSIPGMGRAAGEGVGYPLQYSWATLVTQLVKNPPAVWEVWVRSLGWEDPLEKASILAWRIPWTRIHGVANNRTRLSDFLLSFTETLPHHPSPHPVTEAPPLISALLLPGEVVSPDWSRKSQVRDPGSLADGFLASLYHPRSHIVLFQAQTQESNWALAIYTFYHFLRPSGRGCSVQTSQERASRGRAGGGE